MKPAPQQTEEVLSWLARALKERGAVALTIHPGDGAGLGAGLGPLVVIMPDTLKMGESPLDMVAWLQNEERES